MSGSSRLASPTIPTSESNQAVLLYYLPIQSRYWSIAMAVLVVTLLVGIVLGNCLINSLCVPSLDSMTLIHGRSIGNQQISIRLGLDRHSRKPGAIQSATTEAISPVSDLDLAFVNRVLYSSHLHRH